MHKPTLRGLAWLALMTLHGTAGAAEPLTWAGCGITKLAFMAELASSYEKKTGIPIVLEGGGATKGIRRVAEKSVAIGGTCRAKIDGVADESATRLNPVAWDALVVIVHPDNPVKNLSMAQLRAVYEGRIDNWRKLGGSDQPLHLMVRQGKISGVGRTLRDLVFHDLDKDFVAYEAHKSTGPLEQAVERDPLAIAVTGVGSAHKRAVAILQLEGKEPSYSNISSGDYLLYRPLYIAFNPAHPRADEIQQFLDFAHSRTGRDIIRRAGAVPYLDAIHLVRKQREQWDRAHAVAGRE